MGKTLHNLEANDANEIDDLCPSICAHFSPLPPTPPPHPPLKKKKKKKENRKFSCCVNNENQLNTTLWQNLSICVN